jgi:hypothetical protein
MLINSFNSLPLSNRYSIHWISWILNFTDCIILQWKISVNKNNTIYFVYNSNEKWNNWVDDLLWYNSAICLSTEYWIDSQFKALHLDIE